MGPAEAERAGPEREAGAARTLRLQTSDSSRQAPTWDPFGVPCPPPGSSAPQRLGEAACRSLLELARACLGQGQEGALQAGPCPRGRGAAPSFISGRPAGVSGREYE